MLRLISLITFSIVFIYTIEGVVIEKFITGKVTHTGSNAIDKNAKVSIQLRDTSLMDAPSKLVASIDINDAKTFPISYRLEYNPSDIKTHHIYSLSATIKGPNDKLLYINDVSTRVDLTRSASPTVNVAVIRVGESSSTPATKTTGKKECAPVKCYGKKKTCAYGYQKKDGCEICKCNDPCNPPGKSMICGPKERCFVDKKSNGTFEARCIATSSKNSTGTKDSKSSSTSNAACKQPKVSGRCLAQMQRFYYNATMKKCEPFVYGGCQGNDNNFLTKAACEKACNA